jgi:hypothetical protein
MIAAVALAMGDTAGQTEEMHMAFPSPVRRSFLLVLFVFAGACSSAATGVTVPADRTPATLARTRTLVWTTRGEGAAPVTYVLSGPGEVTDQLPGIHIAAAGTDWTWLATTELVTTAPCGASPELPATDLPTPDEGAIPGAVAGEGHAVRVRLVPSDAAHDPLAIVVPPDAQFANEIEHSSRLLGSMGPYLFVEESTYVYACGAHGNTGVSFAVWNIEEGGTVDLLDELPDRGLLIAAGQRAIDAEPDATDFSSSNDPPLVTEVVPRLDRNGQLEVMALVTVPSCYACTHGGWSSYTSSTRVSTELPATLRAMGPVPREVILFADRHPDLSIGGYSFEAFANGKRPTGSY